MEIKTSKQLIRKEIAQQKKQCTAEERRAWSATIMHNLTQQQLFRQANRIVLYHDLPGEVETTEWIESWYTEKEILLPVVIGDTLQLRLYKGKESLQQGAFGIWEPDDSCPIFQPTDADLIVVPGVAFDRSCNRLGRGRGFYDRLLADQSIPTIGICYHFQLRDEIPVEPFDRRMDLVITEQETIQSNGSLYHESPLSPHNH